MANYLIIGASSGIGKALMESTQSNGNQVFGTYFSNTEFSEKHNFHYLNACDQEMNLDFLPDKLDGLAYCPGAIDLKPFTRLKITSLIDDLNLQLFGAIRVIQNALPKLKASGAGSILLFSTVAVQKGFPFHSQVAVSKGAIEGLTKSLAAEFAPNIRVNAIAPSITNTPLAKKILSTPEKITSNSDRHPLKRIGNVKDIAEMGTFLLSEKSSWITGQIFHIDGGLSAM
jgi:NAD(P)-dependent dehydrogenase (short-subunit alcohol dehydrogenase family)